ncbi:hypothetical protein RvVAR0630_09660 [Agrobacterium vitis]|uniref:AAA family ATPase n=1 Tax=Agrobacterium vitis TaxID=373 RepID=UPI0015DD04BD|nr:AAA family ATPase [Agrobacterium vitis]BCH58342.1 hypothetical protein RvVAR0630_09660 [Agrobacterium vitis]
MLRITYLELRNFRRFERFSIDFHNELTVIVARNGQGKTSVLDGVSMALGTFVGAFDRGKAQGIDKSDARLVRMGNSSESATQYPVYLEAIFDAPSMKVARELTGPKNKTTVKSASEITRYGEHLQASIRTAEQVPLPIVAYYGAGRLWKVHKNMERKQVVSADRTMGYEDCLSPSSNFVQCQQWMAKATLARQQEMELPADERPLVSMADRIGAIQHAVDIVLENEGWSRFSYSFAHEELVMFNSDAGFMPVSMLSDGVRAMVSLVADIAFRCVRLNGYMGREAIEQTCGIVLIDEVDIHLHPAWQQRVIGTMRKAFPNIQFVVTTHSPQVLTSVENASIRIIENEYRDGSGTLITISHSVDMQTKGVASSDVLSQVMDVDPFPPLPIVKEFREYKDLIQQNYYDTPEALELRGKLIDLYGEKHFFILECDRLIRLAKYRATLKQKADSRHA